jgi:hypothetical protein
MLERIQQLGRSDDFLGKGLPSKNQWEMDQFKLSLQNIAKASSNYCLRLPFLSSYLYVFFSLRLSVFVPCLSHPSLYK